MPKYIDRAEVERVGAALARLGSEQDYALVLEPVRGWYYVLLVNTVQADADPRPRGTRTAKTWRVEQEFGPLSGSDARHLARDCYAAHEHHKRGDDTPKPVLVFVLCGDPALAVGKRTRGVAVHRNGGVESWQLARAEHVRTWPDLEGLAPHGEYKRDGDKKIRLEDLFRD